MSRHSPRAGFALVTAFAAAGVLIPTHVTWGDDFYRRQLEQRMQQLRDEQRRQEYRLQQQRLEQRQLDYRLQQQRDEQRQQDYRLQRRRDEQRRQEYRRHERRQEQRRADERRQELWRQLWLDQLRLRLLRQRMEMERRLRQGQ
jgi:hypothetical protein